MNNQLTRRKFLTAMGGAGLTAGLLGTVVPSRAQNAGKGITVGMEAGSPYEKFYKTLAPQFTAQTGISVNILGVPHDNMHQQFLLDGLAGTGSYDVYEADQPWVPEFAQRKFIVNLNDKVKDRQDFVGNTLETVSYKGNIYALPFIVHNIVMYYRTDLFEQAGISAPPATWDEYREYAKKLTKKESGVWGTLVEGKQNGEVAVRLHSFIQQAGGDVVDKENRPTLDSPAGLAALQLMTQIAFQDQSSPPGLLDLTDMQGLFLDGKLAMCPIWPYLYSVAKDPKQSKVAGKFAIALAPGHPDRVGTIFSWGFCVSSASKHQDEAWEWVKWSTGTKVLTEFGRNQLSPVPRKSAVEQVAAEANMDEADKQAIATMVESVAGSRTMPMIPEYPQIQDVLAIVTSSVMSKGQSPADALKTGQGKLKTIMKV
jgi:multiple sugar transport system substrate-binding protein